MEITLAQEYLGQGKHVFMYVLFVSVHPSYIEALLPSHLVCSFLLSRELFRLYLLTFWVFIILYVQLYSQYVEALDLAPLFSLEKSQYLISIRSIP